MVLNAGCFFFFFSLPEPINLAYFSALRNNVEGRHRNHLPPAFVSTCSIARSRSEFPWVQEGCYHRLSGSLPPCCCEMRRATATTFCHCLLKRSSVGLLRRPSFTGVWQTQLQKTHERDPWVQLGEDMFHFPTLSKTLHEQEQHSGNLIIW